MLNPKLHANRSPERRRTRQGCAARRAQRRRGSALIMVMGVLVLLSIIGTTFVMLMRIELHAAKNFAEDVEMQFLAKKALDYCLEHPSWIPPATIITSEGVDNDDNGQTDSQFFTNPLADLGGDTHARFAILKKPFGGRVNVNCNSFYIPNAANDDGWQASNEGAWPTEISLEKAIAAYLNWLIDTYSPFVDSGGQPAQKSNSLDIAREIAGRICNCRYGQATAYNPPLPPYPVFHGNPAGAGVTHNPGVNGVDDPPADDTAANVIDDNGDGVADEPTEATDEPQEFLQFPPFVGDDTPFGSADLQAIIFNAGNPPLKIIVNDVFETWAPAQGYPGYGVAGFDYFNWFRPLFTTQSSDFIGTQTPLNEVIRNLATSGLTFVHAMTDVFRSGGVEETAAVDTAWQVLANLTDYLDDDGFLDPPANTIPANVLTVLAVPGGRTFHGTERQPYLNEFWIYNRENDRLDNDPVPDGAIDGADNPAGGPPVPPQPWEDQRNGYYIELYNHYATPICLYWDSGVAANPKVDWAIRVVRGGGEVRPETHLSTSLRWDPTALPPQWVARNPAVAPEMIVIPPGGYLVIETRDYSGEPAPAGSSPIPAPSPTVGLVNLNRGETEKFFDPGDTIELIYSYTYDPDGAGPLPVVTDEVVVDRQVLPDNMTAIETAAPGGVSDCAPSWERQDPRLAFCVRDTAVPKRPLMPTYSYYYDGVPVPPAARAAGTEGDALHHTLGRVNDDGDDELPNDNPFDGNYDLGKDDTRYDDLVEIPNNPNARFGNAGGLGSLLCVGPMPVNPAATGWLVERSPYTAVPDTGLARPLDAKKVNFIDRRLTVPPDPVATPDDDPLGAAGGVFDKFTTWSPRTDGKDNDGDGHVDDDGETYVYGRVNINDIGESAWASMAALPFVVYNYLDTDGDGNLENVPSYYVPGIGPGAVPDFYITVVDDPTTPNPNCIRRIREGLPGGWFESRRQFYENVVRPAIDPAGVPARNFGCDKMDNHIYRIDPGTGWKLARNVDPTLWGTTARIPRTATAVLPNRAPTPAMFILPGQRDDGGDLLVDDKSEIDYTVGALMNMITIQTELPQEFEALTNIATVTVYYVTVQITDGRDTDGVDDTNPPDGIGVAEPDWDEGTVLAEKRIVVVVNNALPSTDPRRIQVFNWAVQGRYPEWR